MVDLRVNVSCDRRLRQGRERFHPIANRSSVDADGELPSFVPITWTIDHEQRVLTAVCEGDVTLRDIEGYLDAVVVAGSMPYRKLFDGTRGESAMTDEEMMLLGARIRAYHGKDDMGAPGAMGALAIVVVSDHTHGLARLFGALAAADRPIKIFRDVRAARRWLDAQPA